MSDIHIGKSPFNEKKGLIKIGIYFHVPNSKANNVYPGLTPTLDSAGNPIPVSIAPGVTAQELIDLESGVLYEVFYSKYFAYDGTIQRKNEIKTEIKGLWQDFADNKQTELDNEYPFYGLTLSKAV